MLQRHADFARLERDLGIVLPGAMDYLPDHFRSDFQGACDAQPTLITNSNSGIPNWLTTFWDPKAIEVLVAPMKAAEIFGEAKKGDWVTETAVFTMIERTGQASAYGDYSMDGTAGANAQFPQRQSYHYQTFTQYGEREVERMGLARLDWVGRLNSGSALTLNKFQNQTYFYGVSGLANYGALNDPSLSAAITPGLKSAGGTAWITAGKITATANEIFADIQAIFIQLQTQSSGLIEATDAMTLAMSPTSAVALTATNEFNVNVYDLLKKNFPNIRFETAIEYATTAGQFVQLIADSIEGQQTATTAFTEKMRAHAIVVEPSAWKQKKSQGTWGTIIWMPLGIASMIGV